MLSILLRKGGRGRGGKHYSLGLITTTATTSTTCVRRGFSSTSIQQGDDVGTEASIETSSGGAKTYASTLKNLQIGAHTRLLVQGFTGRNATANAQESMAWGTTIVGGVVPSRSRAREEQHLGRPLFPTVRAAVDQLRPDATAVYVPAPLAAAAIHEAIEAEVPLIVAVAEHVPVHDMLRVHDVLRTQTASRLVGPNTPGILNASTGNRCRIGFQPLSVYVGGCVGIVAKSGTLSYEAAASTTRAGLGQSLCVGVGGDMVPGTDMDEALAAVVADGNTRAVALIGEIGGDAEVRAAEWIVRYHAATPEAERKPIAFLLAGHDAARGCVMGHSGAFWQPGDPTLDFKHSVLQKAGASPVYHPSDFGPVLASLLKPAVDNLQSEARSRVDAPSDRVSPQVTPNNRHQQSSLLTTSTTIKSPSSLSLRSGHHQQTRKLHLDTRSSMHLWKEANPSNPTAPAAWRLARPHYLALSIDRSSRDLCVLTCSNWSPGDEPKRFNKVALPPAGRLGPDLDLRNRISRDTVKRIVEASGWADIMVEKKEGEGDKDGLLRMTSLLQQMARLFLKYEAKAVTLQFLPPPPRTTTGKEHDSDTSCLEVVNLSVDLDDAAYRGGASTSSSTTTGHRFSPAQYDLYRELGASLVRDEGSREAERHGLVYYRMMSSPSSSSPSPSPSAPPSALAQQPQRRAVGIIVNGAGLAMNTMDELARHGVPAANFLDTGGLATSATVARSVDLVLRDERVRVIFVNIFGGLTKGEMIARGILQALEERRRSASAQKDQDQDGKQKEMREVPVVVRIQGTGGEEGRRLIREAAAAEGGGVGGGLFTYGDFDEALRKVQEVVASSASFITTKRTLKSPVLGKEN